jgi:hypothetical protein
VQLRKYKGHEIGNVKRGKEEGGTNKRQAGLVKLRLNEF